MPRAAMQPLFAACCEGICSEKKRKRRMAVLRETFLNAAFKTRGDVRPARVRSTVLPWKGCFRRSGSACAFRQSGRPCLSHTLEIDNRRRLLVAPAARLAGLEFDYTGHRLCSELNRTSPLGSNATASLISPCLPCLMNASLTQAARPSQNGKILTFHALRT